MEDKEHRLTISCCSGIEFRHRFNSREFPRMLFTSFSAAPGSPCGVAEQRQCWWRPEKRQTQIALEAPIWGDGREAKWGCQCVVVHTAAKRQRGGNYLTNPVRPLPPGSSAPEQTTSVSIRPAQPHPPPLSNTMPIEVASFYERGPSIEFQSPTSQRGYLPQINEKLGPWISWDVAQVGGDPHLPIFVCVPGKHSL